MIRPPLLPAPVILLGALVGAAAGAVESASVEEQLQRAVEARAAGQRRAFIDQVNAAWKLAQVEPASRMRFPAQALDHGFPRAARIACDEVLPEAPDDAALAGTCGTALVELEDYAAALPLLERALRGRPENARWWTHLGWARLNLYQVEDAFRALDRATALAPDDVAGLRVRAESAMRTLRLEDCIRTCRKIVQLDPSSARTHVLLVRALRLDGQHRAALAAAVRALDSLGEGAELLLERGRVQLDAGRPAEAIPDLMRAARLAPQDPRPHGHLAVAYTRIGEPERAAQARQAYESLAGESHVP